MHAWQGLPCRDSYASRGLGGRVSGDLLRGKRNKALEFSPFQLINIAEELGYLPCRVALRGCHRIKCTIVGGCSTLSL